MPPIRLFVVDHIPGGSENMLTHFFFGVLKELAADDPSVMMRFFECIGLGSENLPTDGVLIEEQVREGGNIYDVVIEHPGSFRLVIEAKLDAGIDMGQLQRYIADARMSMPRSWVVAITPRPEDAKAVEAAADPSIRHVTWQDLGLFMEKISVPPSKAVLRERLIELMKEEEVAPVELRLPSENTLRQALRVVSQLRVDMEHFLREVARHVPYPSIGLDRWDWTLFEEPPHLRWRYLVTRNRTGYDRGDALVTLFPASGQVDFTLYAAVRDWDRGRKSGKPVTAYLEEAVAALVELQMAQPQGPASDFRVAAYRWDQNQVFWDHPLRQVDDLQRQLDAVKNRWDQPNTELVVSQEVALSALIPPGDVADGTLQWNAERTADLARAVADRFRAFVEALRPALNRLDHD